MLQTIILAFAVLAPIHINNVGKYHYGDNMTKRESATLCFKVMSVYAIIQATAKVSYVIYYIFTNNLSENDRLSIISWFIEPLSWLACGFVLWFIASSLALRIFKSAESESIADTSIQSIQITAFSIAGLYLVASVLPELLKSVAMDYSMRAYAVHGASPLTGTIIISVLQIVFGLWLLLGSRGLVNFIRSTRRD
jgi:hypothetical protein